MDFKNRLIRNRFVHRRLNGDYDSQILDKSQLEKIYNYLENPTYQGVWKFEGKWIKEGISKDIDQQLTLKIENPKEDTSKSRRLKKELPAIRITSNKFSFIFSLFTRLSFEEKSESKPIVEEYQQIRDEYQQILDELDLPTLKKKYIEAYNFFKNEIYTGNLDLVVKPQKITKIKGSFFMFLETEKTLKSERDYEEGLSSEIEFNFVSVEKEGLKKICAFFEKIGKVRNFTIKPKYSPEEVVFLPYLYFLQASYLSFIDGDTSTRLINKAISNYDDEEYSDCVSAIGLVVEEYFVQIYETLFRNTAPKIPLGEFYKELHERLKKEFRKEAIIPSKEDLIKRINFNFEKIIDKKNLVPVLKMIVRLIEDRDNYLLKK